ncbi:MAG: autotransporter outer membrane beta-barrel domain-containing protein [Rhodospirillaceae bacterium]|nr:autotransporter outer membrane beta-barrel domain-containing protein [Rhodospirillaceae bacterium]
MFANMRLWSWSYQLAGILALAVLASAAPVQAQTTPVCSDTPATGQRIECTEDAASTDDIAIDTSGLTIDTSADDEPGIGAFHAGEGTIAIESRSDSITTAGQNSHGIEGRHTGASGDVFLRVLNAEIETMRTGASADAHGIFGETTASGRLDAFLRGGSIATLGDGSHGIFLGHKFAGSGPAGPLTLDVGGIAIETSGENAYGIIAERESDGDIRVILRDATIGTAGTESRGVFAGQDSGAKADIVGDVRIDLLGGVRITTKGERADGSVAQATGNDPSVRSDVTVTARGDNSIVTEGDSASGVIAQRYNGGAGNVNFNGGVGNVLMDLRGLSVTTGGSAAHGVYAIHFGTGDIDIRLSGGGVTTRGVGARGVIASRDSGDGDIRIVSRNHRIVTESTEVDATEQVTGSHGIEATRRGLGDIVIDLWAGSIETKGTSSHGVNAGFATGEGRGNVRVRTGGGHSITTRGNGAHGINASYFGTAAAGTSAIFIDVGGSVRADGADAHGIAVGDLDDNGAVEGASPFDDDGYRRQTVRVNGRVYGGSGDGVGIFLAGGGRVFIGPRGLVGALSGVAVRAAGTTVVDGQTVPRKLLVHLMPGGRSPAALLDGTIVNDGGETVYAVYGTALYDTEEGGRTGLWAPNGARDVTLVEDFTGLDFSSADSFMDRYAPRAAVYEALPGALLRLDAVGSAGAGGMEESAGDGRLRQPGSPLWLRVSVAAGRNKPRDATVGARGRYTRYAAEAGMDFRLAEGLTGWAGARLVRGTARVSSPAGGGRIAAAGYGLAGGLAWRSDAGLYAAGRLALTHYSADLTSSARGDLKKGATGLAHAAGLEGGRRFDLGGGTSLTARAWLNRSGISMGRFTDAVGSRVSVDKADRLAAGAGVAATRTFGLDGGADSLALNGALGVERSIGTESTVAVSGEKLKAGDPAPRLLIDAGMAWRSGSYALRAAAQARGLLSRDAEFGGRLELGMAF